MVQASGAPRAGGPMGGGESRGYVFLSSEPFKFAEGDIAFEGAAGAVLFRGDKPVLVLGAPGRLSAKGQVVTFAH